MPRLPALMLCAALCLLPFWPLGARAVAAETAPPTVVATVKPLHSLVAAVMQGAGTPHLLVRGAASPHAFTLKPSDATALSRAALIVRVGPALEGFLDKPLRGLGRNSRVLSLQDVPGMRLLSPRQGGEWGDHHGHDHGHNHGHDHGKGDQVDGHLWLDPRNALVILDAVAGELAAIDPTRAALYRANAARAVADITLLDAELAAALAPIATRPFIVFHDAYAYLETRYGLNAVGAITVSPERPPGARRLSELRRRIATLGAVCIFAEPQFEPALVATVAEGTAARTGTLDPEGATLADGPELYPALMRANARALRNCLQ